MLTAILAIGPLARLDRRFLPLLYNRRHLGVMTLAVALLHAWSMIDWYLVQNALPNARQRAHRLGELREVHRLSLQGAR